jgi:hypothetical protein
MRWVLNKHLVFAVLFTFAVYVLPPHSSAGSTLVSGKRTSTEAAQSDDGGTKDLGKVIPLRFAVPLSHNYAQPDTTEFEFPEDEEKHLARDITVFLIVSAFVAFFVIKVFLEGDTEEEPSPPDDGKQPPPS